MKNKFLKALHSFNTFTENGALSHSTSGSAVLDYFAKCGTYRDRDLEVVFADMSRMWAESPLRTLQVIFYNRMISRVAKGMVASEKVQSGQGNRSEFRASLVWLAKFKPAVLYANLWLVPVAGAWKDLWHEELIDSLDLTKVYALIAAAMEDDYNQELLAKYLPRIRSKSNCYNERHEQLNKFAFGLIKVLKWSPSQYRKFKASGKAHGFQRQMCSGQWKDLQFNQIAGKALFQLVNNRGKDGKTTIERHAIEADYVQWISAQPTAKFTGYVYELMKAVNAKMTIAQKITVDKQFDGLINLAKADEKNTENVWCALDTSGSMTMKVANTSAYDICVSLGVYFSTLNEGAFKDQVIMFDSLSRVLQLSGSFSDKVTQIQSANTAWGSTNFQSVIDEIVRVRKQNPSIPVAEFPTTLVVVSDMQFNPVNGNTQTNYQRAMQKLASVGLPSIRIVWWWVTGRGEDFPNQMDNEGLVMIGGFDGTIISKLLGEEVKVQNTGQAKKQLTAFEAMLKALDQEVLNELQLAV